MNATPAIEAPHKLTAQEAVSLLDSDSVQGLGPKEAFARLERFGTNDLPEPPRAHPLKLLAGQFRSLLVVVLLVASVLSFVIWLAEGEEPVPYDTLIILAIVIANAALGFFQEYRAEQSLEKLRALSGPVATVIRGGSQRRVAASDVVPGDILALATGDKITADARICETFSLEVNESSLTGESAAVHKSIVPVVVDAPLADRTSMLYAGTAVSRGRALAVVTATGGAPEVGKIAELIQSAPSRETPLQKSLDQLGRKLGLLVIAIAVVVSATGLIMSGSPDWNTTLDMLLFGVALAVAAIPEGLPAVVTGALALGTQRMARRRAIVRKLPAVETLGSTTCICSDKTGTLTVGEMTVREILTTEGVVTLEGGGYDPEGEIRGTEPAVAAAAPLLTGAVLCNDASIRETGKGRWLAVGSPTESALVTAAVKLGLDYDFLRRQNQRLAEEPFSSERKQMTVLVSSGGGGAVIHSKGAPEVILGRCTMIAGNGGLARPMTGEERQDFLEAAAGMARRALRPLAVATRHAQPECTGDITACEKEMIFLGIAGIADPPRPEAALSVQRCLRAGIDVYMVTGDHLATAEAIAAEVGITGQSMTGPRLDLAGDDELDRIVGDVRIFARVAPGHKVRIVSALQRQGHIVAVTGDGVNDAPALKQADIGVAMGLAGTDVAREAADMVLADDNFATIVAAVEEGRSIFANIRKFVTYLLSSNSGEVLTVFAGVLFAGWFGLRDDGRLLLPLLAVQILWINLVTDGLPALALGVDPAERGAMELPPRPRKEPVINARVWTIIVLVGLVSGVVTLFLFDAYFAGGFFELISGRSAAYARTIAFITLALLQMFNVFNCRHLVKSSLPRLLGNRWLLIAVALSVAMMVAVVHVPLLQRAFNTEPLRLIDWLIATAFASLVLWTVELFKLLSRSVSRNADQLPLR